MNDEHGYSMGFEFCPFDWDIASGREEHCPTTQSPMHVCSGSLMHPFWMQDTEQSPELLSSRQPAPYAPGPPQAAHSRKESVLTQTELLPQRSSGTEKHQLIAKVRSTSSKELVILDDYLGQEPHHDEEERANKHRAVNRKTAAKARNRDKVQTAALEKSFEDATARNPALKRTMVALHEELYNLQMEALQHVDCDCTDIQQYNRKRARKFSRCWDLDQVN